MFISAKGKEPQRIEVTVSSTTFNRVNTVVPILHLLNPEGNRKCHPPCELHFRKLETRCSSAHNWVPTELNWVSIVFQAKSTRRKSSIAVWVSLLLKNKLPKVSKPEFMVCVSALLNWTLLSRAGRCLAVEILSVWVSVSDESILMEKLECFRTLPRGRWGLLSKKKFKSLCVCMSNISRPKKLEFPLQL